MARIKMHIPKAKLPFYPPCEVKYRLQNGVSTLACAQITPRLPDFGYMPMASRATIKKLWRADIIWITQENTIITFSHNK